MKRRKRARVLFYNHTGQVSGGERMLLLLLRNLSSRFVEAIVACPEDGPLAKACEEVGVEVRKIGRVDARFTVRPDRAITYVASMLKVSLGLRHLTNELQPDLIHANSVRAGLVANLATFNMTVPVIWHVHDILPSHPFTTVIRHWVRRSARIHLIACSAAAARSISNTGQVRIVRNAIELDRFHVQSNAGTETRRQLGFDESSLLIGVVGQIAKRKGQLGVVEAFADVLPSIPNAALLFVGSPLFDHDYAYTSGVKARVDELGVSKRVRFLGQRADIADVMHAFDVLVLNSENEPLGLVLGEAMACGTPVVATRGGGVPEIVSHRESGLLVDYGDRQALARAIREIHQNRALRSTLISNGRRFVERHLGVTRYVSEVESLYRTLLPAGQQQAWEMGSCAEAI